MILVKLRIQMQVVWSVKKPRTSSSSAARPSRLIALIAPANPACFLHSPSTNRVRTQVGQTALTRTPLLAQSNASRSLPSSIGFCEGKLTSSLCNAHHSMLRCYESNFAGKRGIRVSRTKIDNRASPNVSASILSRPLSRPLTLHDFGDSTGASHHAFGISTHHSTNVPLIASPAVFAS